MMRLCNFQSLNFQYFNNDSSATRTEFFELQVERQLDITVVWKDYASELHEKEPYKERTGGGPATDHRQAGLIWPPSAGGQQQAGLRVRAGRARFP